MRASYLVMFGLGIAIGFLIAQLARSRGSDQVEIAPEVPGLGPGGAAKGGDLPADPPPAEELGGEDLVAAPEDPELQAYLDRHDHSREAVIAAALLSGDIAYLLDAVERFPDDPHVQLLVIAADQIPGDKGEWYARFREAQPDNLLASLLLGNHLLENGSNEVALEELRTASRLSSYDDFSSASSLAMESALIEMGRSPLEAKVGSNAFAKLFLLTSQLNSGYGMLKGLMGEAGSPEQKEDLAMLGVAIGNQLSQGGGSHSAINRLVGFAMEENFLKQLDPDLESRMFSQTPAEMIEQIRIEKAQLRADVEAISSHYEELDERQMIHYLDRIRTVGEADALAWVRAQLGLE